MPSDQPLARQRIEQAPVERLPEPVSRPDTNWDRPASKQIYEAPVTDPWEVLRRNLPPDALEALERVTGKTAPGIGNAPWYECWDVAEGRPTGHPHFQGVTKPGQHVYCPVCQRKTVMPLENYVPA